MKTIRVIDLLNKIANGEEVPKKIKVNDLSLSPYYRELTFDEDLQLYIHNDENEFTSVLDNYHLNYEIEIIEDTPKEDKKIEKLDYLNSDYYYKNNTYGAISAEEIVLDIKAIENYINKIVDKINGDSNE